MLQLKNICKSYTTGDFVQHALNGVSLDFRENEFVAILGQSGSGKTTLLNIVGGLDRYDSGDLIINGTSTRQFKNTDWDAYRNNSVGFIFQSYNLIGHISVLQNVEMGMTLSGVSAARRRQKALDLLEKVGIKEHAKKKPAQLSGGQMQRVAIARALANDPDIILADEPTGALDSETSIQIMNLIKEIAKDKLVIMVTHNPGLASEYADRIIELQDGQILSDSHPLGEDESVASDYKLKKTAMSYPTALKLSFNNILTKKGRTILTAFAASIGIIGIALVMALSNGFDKKIDEFESSALAQYPVVIQQQAMDMSVESMQAMHDEAAGKADSAFPSDKKVFPYDKKNSSISHQNKLTDDYIKYLDNIDKSLISGVSYIRGLNMNLLMKSGDTVKPVSASAVHFSALPQSAQAGDGTLENNYDILAGQYPASKTDIVLVVDNSNRVDKTILEAMGLDGDAESLPFDKIVGMTFKLAMNDDYYQEIAGRYTVTPDLQKAFDSQDSITVKIAGIVRIKEDSMLTILQEGLAYTEDLAAAVADNAKDSAIVKAQKDSKYNVLTGEPFDLSTEEGKQVQEQTFAYLGATTVPYDIMIFPKDFDAKAEVLAYLDEWNKDKSDADTIVYTDLADVMTTLSGDIMDAITIVLVAFSAISLVVSSIMIGIITYISVLERTKEIGVLRALGARKKDIHRVFDAETFIIGLCSGGLGIFIAWLLTFPVNAILKDMTDLPNVAQINPLHALILIVVSVALTVIGGLIPSKLAAKRDPVVALRSE